MTSTNNQSLFDWAVEQDQRIAWVLTHNKKPVEMGWQQNPHKVGEGLESALVANDYANALGVNLGHSSLMGLDFDADDWPQQFADLAGVSVEEGKALLREQTYVVSPRMIADGTTPRLKVLVPFDQELAQAFADTGCKNKVTESKNGGIGIFGGTGVQFAVYGPYSQKVGDELIEGDYKPRNFNQIRPCGDVLRHAVLAMLKRVAESKSYKAKSPDRRFASDSDVQDLDSAVKFLSASADDFSDSDSWFMVMCAIRDGGDSCLGLAHEFCSQMHNYDAREIDRRWDNGDFDPKPGKTTKATLFQLAAERGWKNPAKGRAPKYTQDSSKTPSGGTEEPQRTYTEDINCLLDLELQEFIDQVIPLRKQIKKTHGVNDAKINASLMDAIRQRFSPVAKKKTVQRRRSVRRTSIAKTVYLHDGLTPAASICMTDGPSSAGKSMFEIEKGIATVEGRGCFDRDHPTKQGSVLFIATDSGVNDFYATLDQLGYGDHPALLQGQLMEGDEGYVEGAPSFFVWGESPEDGLTAWTATPANIAQLIEFCRENDVSYIVMDSVKTIMGPVGGYTDNQVVAQFMTMLKSTVCLSTGATICLINHDGVEDGAASGAKAWVENVTMRTRLEPLETPDGARSGTKAIICKDRIGGNARSFGYKFAADAAFELMDDVELVSRADDQIAWILWEAHLNGKPFLKKASILEETRKASIADSTVSNTLSQCESADLIRKKSRGVYELTTRQLEAFKRTYGEMV